MEAISYLLISWLDPWLLFLTAAGTLSGIYVGAIPGLSVTMAASILISFTFNWSTNEALALISGVFVGGVYGGSRTAILLNIPGSPASVATALDGYPMARKGQAGEAIGLTTIMSVMAGLIGVLLLALFAPAISKLAIQFNSRDYMMLGLIGILLVGSLAGKSLAKGLFSGALGVLLGMVGMDMMTGQPRFTFGQISLMSGIPYIVAMIGFFGVAEALYQLHNLKRPVVRQQIDRIIPRWRDVRKHFWLALRASGLGAIIGALPGSGGDTAALLAYDHAKRSTRNPKVPFGEGAEEGLVAPEAANGAAVGGAHIPLLTLGIPGDAVTAVIIGALYIHGLNPGPMLMVETPHLFWFIVGTLVLANVFLLIFGLTGIKAFAKIVECPKAILIPLIIILSAVGAYAIQNNPVHVYWVLVCGVVGYFLKLYGFAMGPIILGAILGPMIDENFRRAMSGARGDVGLFFLNLVNNPITLVLTVFFMSMLLSQTPLKAWLRAQLGRNGGE